MDRRLIKLRALFQSGSALSTAGGPVRVADLVDPLLEQEELVAVKEGSTILGYGFAKPKPGTHGQGAGYVYARPHIGSDRNVHLETFVITGPTTTHTLKLNAAAGGIVDSWRVEKPSASIDGQIVNRYGGWTRGIQAGMHWGDVVSGEAVGHRPCQGGNRFSRTGFSAALAHGGYLTKPISSFDESGGIVLHREFVPVEMDPDGGGSVAAATTWHYGSQLNPVIWRDMVWSQDLAINWRGTENLHRLRTVFHLPFALRVGHFDLERYHMLCLDADVFTQVQYYDAATSTAGVLSDGTVANPNYEAEFRRYLMDTRVIYGDDEGITGSSVLPRRGGIAATGALASDLAVLVGGRMSVPPNDPRSFEKMGGNTLGWLQNRADTGGQDGKNLVMLSHAAHLGGRFHGFTTIRDVAIGRYELVTFIATDTFTDCQTIFDTL